LIHFYKRGLYSAASSESWFAERMFRMMRAAPRMASMRAASLKAQTVMTARVAPVLAQPKPLQGLSSRRLASTATCQDLEFDARYVDFFNRQDLDGWELRKGMADLCAMDLVPEPSVVAAALRACRRLDDFSLTTRILEVVRVKCGAREAEIWPYMLQELAPVLEELGVSTPGELGYDRPELALPNPYNIH